MKTILSRTNASWSRYSHRCLLQARNFHHSDNEKKNETEGAKWDLISCARTAVKGAAVTTTAATATTASTATSTSSTGAVMASSAAAVLVTTAGGYSLTPTALTLISNGPLVAFALVQASGIGPIRQILADGETKELSPFPFVSLYTNCAIWTLYGILQSDQTILLANAAGVAAGIIYTGIFAKNTHVSMMPYYAGSAAILSVMLSSPMWAGATENAVQLLGTFGCASAVILMASPLSVVNTVLKEEATESMPFAMSLAMTVNGTAWGAYGWIVANDPYVYIPNILGAGAGLVQLGLHARFGINSSSKKLE